VTSANDRNGDERFVRSGTRLSAILDRHRIEIEELRRLREARRQLDLAVNAARHPAPKPLPHPFDDCA
jgi:hypothetical protein